MRSDVEAIVGRLRRARSLPWLRVIDEAQLDRPAEQEPSPGDVVNPYRWLLVRIGDGVRLTQAGYLPPALVTEAMAALGWKYDWSSKHRREELTLPILELRESAQRFGLLRKERGRLLVTKAGRGLIDDPTGLWWHLAERMPDARSEHEWNAGVLHLLTVAAGRPADEGLLADGMSILGWADANYQPVSPESAFGAARDTWMVFRRLGLVPRRAHWDQPTPEPRPRGRIFARAALLGRAVGPQQDVPAPTRRRGPDRAVQMLVRLCANCMR